jgi:hypothetical protein
MKYFSKNGYLLNAWQTLPGRLDAKSRIDWKESFADGTFSSAKKGEIKSARPKKAKAQR